MAPTTTGLRTAIAGLGRIGWGFHLQHCSQDPRFDVVAVVDKEAERCAEAREHFPACCAFATWEDFLASSVAVDIIVIATPTRLHQQMACDAMERGCDVIMEKPIAASVSEVDAIASAETGKCAQTQSLSVSTAPLDTAGTRSARDPGQWRAGLDLLHSPCLPHVPEAQ